jgi:hypothetical protein
VPPDSVRCTRTVQMSTSHSREFQGALRYNSPDCSMCHWTVRCASGAMAICANGRLCTDEQYATVSRGSQSSQVRGAPSCPVPQEDKAPTVDPAPNPNGWVTWGRTGKGTVHVRWRTGLSGAPFASSLPNGYESG